MILSQSIWQENLLYPETTQIGSENTATPRNHGPLHISIAGCVIGVEVGDVELRSGFRRELCILITILIRYPHPSYPSQENAQE